MRVLSGIQPTGRFHWGNYFGAIRQYIDLQHGNESYYFIADLHALTTIRQPDELRGLVWDAALDLLALGLDPNQATLYVQSDVPEVSELCWLLMSGAPMGLLERCHAYKDKKAKGLPADMGLFAYPVLMAADILAYDSDVVPVGKDQKQHVEMARDMAVAFNHHFGDVLRVPEPVIRPDVATIPGTDGRKMSKSYGNTIPLFLPTKKLRKAIMRIKTDSTPLEEPKNPDTCAVFQLYRKFADPDRIDDLAARYRAGGLGYGHAKLELFEVMEAHFAEPRERFQDYLAHPETINDILADGGDRAKSVAVTTLSRVRAAVGM
jgi:tryptophanyl-tRNA synthetase